MTRITTRQSAAILALIAIGAGACKPKVGLCARCHMKIVDAAHDTRIAWSDGTESHYDSIACAVFQWQNPGHATPKRMTVHEYYTGDARDAADTLFVQGSNVPSTMGDDFVPVDPANVRKFEADHGGHDMRLSDIKLDAQPKDST